jgi:hypothetical protein
MSISVKLHRREQDESVIMYSELARIRKEIFEAYFTAISSKAFRKQQQRDNKFPARYEQNLYILLTRNLAFIPVWRPLIIFPQ